MCIGAVVTQFADITRYGAVGDGKTSNTAAFAKVLKPLTLLSGGSCRRLTIVHRKARLRIDLWSWCRSQHVSHNVLPVRTRLCSGSQPVFDWVSVPSVEHGASRGQGSGDTGLSWLV